jgi:hypothetical protein
MRNRELIELLTELRVALLVIGSSTYSEPGVFALTSLQPQT